MGHIAEARGAGGSYHYYSSKEEPFLQLLFFSENILENVYSHIPPFPHRIPKKELPAAGEGRRKRLASFPVW